MQYILRYRLVQLPTYVIDVQVFNPSKISSADLDTVTKMFKDNESQLDDALRRQYGTDLRCLQKNFTEEQYKFLTRLVSFVSIIA